MPGEARLAVRARVDGDDCGRPRLDVDTELATGVTAVMGPSGAGKSTLLSTIAGLVRPHSGRIALGDRVLFEGDTGTYVPPHSRRTALVFQSLALFPHLRAWQNVAYGLHGGIRAERRDRALAWLARAHVEHVAERMPSSLSGGEAQRVAIARALASEPRVLLLDEPLSALDAALRRELGLQLRTFASEFGIITILVTHHHEDATALGSRVIQLQQGRIVGDADS